MLQYQYLYYLLQVMLKHQDCRAFWSCSLRSSEVEVAKSQSHIQVVAGFILKWLDLY